MAQVASALGDYLRARREQVHPEEVGLVAGKRRRVAGLRREELATLAGISSAYYLRLEHGCATHPSAQVVDALARALRLDARSTQYLHDLAGPAAGDISDPEVSAHALAEVIDQFLMPAIVVNRYRDVLVANPLARALSPEFTPGQNLLRWRLLNPAARKFYVNWDEATEIAVSGLRELSGQFPSDPDMRALIAELSDASTRFRGLWVAPTWAIAWESTLCVILRWGTFISIATGSTHIIPAATTFSCIALSPVAIQLGRWRSCGRWSAHARSRYLADTKEIRMAGAPPRLLDGQLSGQR